MTREEAIKMLNAMNMMLRSPDGEPVSDVCYALDMAIEALSERTGKWIFEETNEYKRTYCSVCGASAPFVCVSDDYYGRRLHGETRKTKFCSNCGARMLREDGEA